MNPSVKKKYKGDDGNNDAPVKLPFRIVFLSTITCFLVSLGAGVTVSHYLYQNKEIIEYFPLLKKSLFGVPVSITTDDVYQSNDADSFLGGEEDEDEDEDEDDEDDEDEDPEEIERKYYSPGCSHLVKGKINNINRPFLSSPEELTEVMANIIDNTSLKLLSHHCTYISSNVGGVNCIGILSDKSHVSFYTWLDDGQSQVGVLTFGMFLGGPDQVKDAHAFVALLEENVMSHIPRSARRKHVADWRINTIFDKVQRLHNRNPVNDDLGDERFLGNEDVIKIFVKSVHSPFQRIDVYDFVDRKYIKHEDYYSSLTQDGSYPSLHPELFQPNRVIFLDGVMQSLSKGNEVYHEALVQPAMFAHKDPRRVAIIGGGEGATLKEALKHKSVEKVLMIDIDEIMCKESAELLYPAWNGCGDFGPNASCFDDLRADVRYEDALAWFMDRFSDENLEAEDDEEDSSDDEEEDSSDDEDSSDNEEEDFSDDTTDDDEETFDIIVMDALDPQDTIEFAVALYQNKIFWKSLYNALGDDGILVAQLGDAPDLVDPAEQHTNQKNRVAVMKTLAEVGFKSMHVYEEAHCGFENPWTFLVACKSDDCRSNWYASPAKIEHAIHQRIHRSKSGSPLIKHFDGSTMALYNVPHKSFEVVYCRSDPKPEECNFTPGYYHNHGIQLVSRDAFDIGADGQGSVHVLARFDIPQHSHIDTGNYLRIPVFTRKLISKMWEKGDVVRPLESYMNMFGVSSAQTRDELYLSSGVPSLIRHDTNTTANIKPLGSLLKQNVDYNNWNGDKINPYSPVVDRYTSLFSSSYLTVEDVLMGQDMMATLH